MIRNDGGDNFSEKCPYCGRMRFNSRHICCQARMEITRLESKVKELEENINIKADWIDKTINQLAEYDAKVKELEALNESLQGMPEDVVTDFWHKNYSDGHCTLCANGGVINTIGIKTASGKTVGRKNYCLCPNGQAIRKAVEGSDDRSESETFCC